MTSKTTLLFVLLICIAHCAHALEMLTTLAQVEQIERSPRVYALLVVSGADAKEQGSVLELAEKAFPSLNKLERDLDGVATFAVVDVAQHKKLTGKWNLPTLPALLVFKDAPKPNPYTHTVYRNPLVAGVDLLSQPAKLRKLLRDSVPTTFVREIPASELATPDAIEALVQSTTAPQEQSASSAKLVLLVSKQRKPSPLFRALAAEFHDQGLRFAFVQHTPASSTTDAASSDDSTAVTPDTSALLERFGLSHVPALLVVESTTQFAVLADDSMANYKALKAFVDPFADKDAAAAPNQQQQATPTKSRTASLRFLTESSFEHDVLGSKLVWIVAFIESDAVASAVEASWQSAFDELQRKAGMIAVAAVDCANEPTLCARYGGAGIRVFPVALAPHRNAAVATVAAVERGDVLPETFTDVDAAKDAALASLPSSHVHTIQSASDLSGFVAHAAARKALPVVLFTAKTEPPPVLKALALSLPASNVLFGVVPDADPEVKAQFTIPAAASTAFACLVMTDKDKDSAAAATQQERASPFGVILYNKKAMGAYTYENMLRFLLSVLNQYPHPLELAADDDTDDMSGGSNHDDAFATANGDDGSASTASSTLVPYLQRDTMATLCSGNTICAIGFFDEHVDRLSDVDSRLATSMRVLTQVAAASARSKEPFKFMWTSGACQRAFADAFGVGAFQMPTVVVYAPSKQRYAVNVGTFTPENTRAFLQGVLNGKIGTAPIDAVPALRDECSFEELHGVAGDSDTEATDVDGDGDDAELLSEILQEEERQRELLADALRADNKATRTDGKKKAKGKKKKSSKKKSKKKSTRDELRATWSIVDKAVRTLLSPRLSQQAALATLSHREPLRKTKFSASLPSLKHSGNWTSVSCETEQQEQEHHPTRGRGEQREDQCRLVVVSDDDNDDDDDDSEDSDTAVLVRGTSFLSTAPSTLRDRRRQKLQGTVPAPLQPPQSVSTATSMVSRDDDRNQGRLATPVQTFDAPNRVTFDKQQQSGGGMNTTARLSVARIGGRLSDAHGTLKASGSPGVGNPDAVNATLNQDRVNQRVSRIYPLTDSVYVTQTKKTPVEVKFHPVTSHFVNEPRLEKLYEVTFARENSPRSSRITTVFFVLYLIFTGSNISNLFSADAKVRSQSKDYFQLVWLSIVPIPFLIYIGRQRKYEVQFQRVYSLIALCWSVSLIAGGMFSMLKEWYSYVSKDIDILMEAVGISNSTETIYYLNSTANPAWQFKALTGSQAEVLKLYTSEVLLPSATLNINLLRIMLVFVFVPVLRIDTLHFGVVALITCLSYMGLTFSYYPVTDSSPFIQNRILVICFPIMFALVMLVRNRDVDRVIRQDFLHVWAVELEAEKATREKNLIAEENRNLKKELAQRDNDFSLDLTSPLHSLLAELKAFLDETDMSDEATMRGMAILRNLSKLDTNLFMPDISAQMKSETEVDNDTKNWALSVLARKDYAGTRRTGATVSLSSHSNSDTRKSYQNGLSGAGAAGAGGNGASAIAPLLNMPTWEDSMLDAVRTRILCDGWDLDTLHIAEITGNRPLMYVTAAMFEIHELHEEFRIDRVVLRNFLFLLDDGYLANPYHNGSHAADVVNSVNYLITVLSDGQIRDSLTNLEFYAALVAAAIHDFRHPGKSNNYLIKAKHDLAVQYNDRSILESMHVAETFFIMRNPLCDIFGRMKDKPYREIRKAIIEMVLSTDLSMHLQLVGNLKALMLQDANAGNNHATQRAVTDPMMIMKVVIKCADIGHAAKERKLHVLWSSLIIEEFFLQGDDERASNSDISPFMDRHSENSAKNQVGFFEFIVLPFYDTVSQVVFDKDFGAIHSIAKQNYNLWKESDRRQLSSIVAIKNEVFLDDKVQVT